MPKQLIECVPNFSEGRDRGIIQQITNEIESVSGINLLNVDPGKATNRTVVTFAGEPDQVIKAAFKAIKKAGELIDMRQQKGEHPRFGSTDVCPLIPISGISMEEVVTYAKKLGNKVGEELNIPVYLYEHAATAPHRKNLASVRAGEYEGIPKKINKSEWTPDYGPSVFNAQTGNIAISARNFLVAYNINLNTNSVRKANAVAFDVRESGRLKRKRDTGEVEVDENGQPIKTPGSCKAVKAIGWYIEEYGCAQISMNLTNIDITPVHVVFDEVSKSAKSRGLEVTGSELIGLIPLNAMLDAGRHYLEQKKLPATDTASELINIAIETFGLNELAPFNPKERIIEYVLDNTAE